ncbi:MAG: aminopeptidase P family protein, partial [Gemmatimonadetes bacterium]|nr:aminopeptidase P family protein [Gemmatimonadota bacterium]
MRGSMLLCASSRPRKSRSSRPMSTPAAPQTRAARPAALLTPEGIARVQDALAARDLDGWLLFEFRGQNWISAALLDVGHTTRRAWVLIPRTGEPRALVQAIESSAWRGWPFQMDRYSGWREMEEKLARLVAGRRRLAMEVSARSAVPSVDAVPAGALELVRSLGVEPVSSGDLVSTFHSVWTDEQLADHRRAAEVVAEVGEGALREAADAVRAGQPTTEGALSRWIMERLRAAGVSVDADTHVAVGAGAADPHYAPAGEGQTIRAGDVLMVDLWGRTSSDAVFADQTWMGFLGPALPERVAEVWRAVKGARDAAVELLRARHRAGAEVRGFEVDDAAREVVCARGYGDFFVHRTGHSIDDRLHGSGPNL